MQRGTLANDSFPFDVKGVFSIPCAFVQSRTGQMGWIALARTTSKIQ